MCSALATFRDPWNITCSNRWAKPVLPATSCFEPTLYQRLTATTGASRSTAMIRRSPLARRSSVNDTVGWLGIGRAGSWRAGTLDCMADPPTGHREWLTETRKSLPQDVRDAIELLFESELAIHAGVLIVDQPDVRTSADVVALVESTAPNDLVGALFAEDGHDAELAGLIRR